MKLDEALWRAFDGSVRARPVSKHLGTQHDQKTHGRRKNGLAPQAEYETGIGTVKDDMPTPSKVEERRYTNEEALVVAKEMFELSIELSDGRTISSEVVEAYGGLVGDISVRGRIYIKENGEWQQAGNFTRFLYAKDGVVENSFFDITPSLQGQGVGTTILRHWEDQYHQAGFSNMSITAVSGYNTNGAYTWLKYGYTPDEPESLLSEYVVDLMDRFDEGTPPDVVVQHLAPVLDMVGADDLANGYYSRIQSREDSREIADDLEGAIFRSYEEIDPLELVSSSDDFANFLKEGATWDGSKETSPLFSDQYAKSAEASKSARDVINRWMVEDPAGLENDDPKFWQEIRDAYGKVSKHLAGGPYDHDQQTHGRGASGGASLVRAIADEFKSQVSHCQTASGSERQCISAEHQFRTWLSENHPEVAYRSYYVRGAKPEAVAPERLLPLSGGFETEPEWILRDQNHNIPAIGVPDEDGKLQWFTVDWTYRQFQPDSEWPLIEEGATATERWDETTVFNERGPLSKHLAGSPYDHDQSTHGRGKTGARWTRDELRSSTHELRYIFEMLGNGTTDNFLRNTSLTENEIVGAISQLSSLREWSGDDPTSLELGDQVEMVFGTVGTAWNMDPDDPLVHMYTNAAQQVLAREQGISPQNSFGSDYADGYNKLGTVTKTFLQELALAHYLNTQATLKENGIKSVRVWRGMTIDDDSLYPSDPLSQAEVKGRAFSSWTTNYGTARGFATGPWATNTGDSVILHAVVPAEYVFTAGGSAGLYGEHMGVDNEYEVVVLGLPFEADVLTRIYSEGDVDAVLTGERSPFREGEEVEKAKKVIFVDEDERNRKWLRPLKT